MGVIIGLLNGMRTNPNAFLDCGGKEVEWLMNACLIESSQQLSYP